MKTVRECYGRIAAGNNDLWLTVNRFDGGDTSYVARWSLEGDSLQGFRYPVGADPVYRAIIRTGSGFLIYGESKPIVVDTSSYSEDSVKTGTVFDSGNPDSIPLLPVITPRDSILPVTPFLLDVDSAGVMCWWKSYGELEGLINDGKRGQMIQSWDGGYILCGYTETRYRAPQLVKFDTLGTITWRFTGADSLTGAAASVAELPNHNIILLLDGKVNLPGKGENHISRLITFNAAGKMLSVKTLLQNPGAWYLNDLVAQSDGTISTVGWGSISGFSTSMFASIGDVWDTYWVLTFDPQVNRTGTYWGDRLEMQAYSAQPLAGDQLLLTGNFYPRGTDRKSTPPGIRIVRFKP